MKRDDTEGRESGNVFTDALARDSHPRTRRLAAAAQRALLAPVRFLVFLLLVASLLLPPALGVGLIVDGVRHARVGSVVFGVLVLALIAMLARTIFARQKKR
jgi:hypothetical protein